MAKILVVDDDSRLLKTLAINFRARGYDVVTAGTGTDALRLAASASPDVIVLDMGLPDIDGGTVLEGIRGWSNVPVVILTARADPLISAAALDRGADDYVTKPFAMEELLARIRAALRHGGPRPAGTTAVSTPVIEVDDLYIDIASHELRKAGASIHLTPTEWGVLAMLIRAQGALVRKEEILAEVWGESYRDQGHYLRIYTSQLRRKIEDDPSQPRHLLTEPGLGYRFVVG
ncbi:response regulator [Corynebacterium epidermidicanis]|uniref:Transcriptional regulatory protein KdpE n=1 Tax=Corynebacterium epidermidicanis TaxID=1050174 RepID=A0A0G3GQT9_9CORY|nr:response regulator transcription factor [Corynebacterium epidermidicanis]AKK01928.1 Transcriptional regulatory protein KdpE [Corynebacterium epidermidicanis]